MDRCFHVSSLRNNIYSYTYSIGQSADGTQLLSQVAPVFNRLSHLTRLGGRCWLALLVDFLMDTDGQLLDSARSVLLGESKEDDHLSLC